MKNQKKNMLYLGLAAVCGAGAGVMRSLLLATGLDEKGLLVSGSPLTVGLWVLSVGLALVLLVLLRGLKQSGSFPANFPPCKIRFALSVTGGVLLTVHSLGQLLEAQMLAGVLGVAAGVGMLLAGVCRLKGSQPLPLYHILACVFFLVRLILSFRGWSSDPQLQDYALQMLALVCLMLFAFHRSSADAGILNRRRTAFFGLMAIYFCLASLSDETMPLLYLASGAWAAGAMGTLEDLPEESILP